MQQKTIELVQNLVTVGTIAIGVASLYFAFPGPNIAWLLLGFVILGTAYDFCSHVIGRIAGKPAPSLEIYARFNFAALCFGIPFTSLAATFVIAEVAPGGINSQIAMFWPQVLIGSLLFGGLFLFARYKTFELHGAVEYTLDKSHGFTRTIFLVRRVLLAVSVILTLVVMYEGFTTNLGWWTFSYSILFIATVPLHILHRPVASMVAEAATLLVLFYGTYRVFEI